MIKNLKIKRLVPALLTFVMMLNLIGIAMPQKVSAAKAGTNRYELYDYFLDVQESQKNGTPVKSTSPWTVELRDVRNNWGETTNKRTEIDKYLLNSDNYMFAYSSKEAWDMYPGYSFNTVPNAGGVRLYLNTISPTNSGYGDSATNGWRINAAYTFTAPDDGSYTLGTADQDKVYSFDQCNNFKQYNLDEKIDFGVKITLNNTTVWPKAGEAKEISSDGFAVFGNKSAKVKEIAVPTVKNIIMSAGDKVRIEFTSFTPITANSYTQRVTGTVAMTCDKLVDAAAEVGGVKYLTLEAAINAASANQEIKLINAVTASNIMLSGNKTLNLNGNNLTVDSVITLKGSHIVDNSINKGIMIVNNKNETVLDESNKQIVMFNGKGYIFGKTTMNQRVEPSEHGKFIFVLQPLFEEKVTSTEYFFDGASDNNVTLGVMLKWTTADGNVNKYSVVYSDSLVKQAYIKGNIKALNITVSGLKLGTEVEMYSFIESNDFGVVASGTPISYTVK